MTSKQSFATLAALIIAGSAVVGAAQAHEAEAHAHAGEHAHAAKTSVLGEPGKATGVNRTV